MSTLFDFYKELYEKEIDYKEKISNRISVPIGIISLLSGLDSYLLLNTAFSTNDSYCIALLVLIVLFNVSLGVSVYYTVKSYHGYKYLYISYPKEIEEYSKPLRNYYSENYDAFFSNTDLSIEELTYNHVKKELLYEMYLTMSDHNMKLNKKKTKYLFRTGMSIAIAIILGIAASTVFILQYKIVQEADKQEITNENVITVQKGGDTITIFDKLEKIETESIIIEGK